MGKTEGQAPPDSQSLDSIILLTASTTSDDEYLPPELFITNPMALLAAFSFFL